MSRLNHLRRAVSGLLSLALTGSFCTIGYPVPAAAAGAERASDATGSIALTVRFDLPQQADLSELAQAPLAISAKESTGLDALEAEIARRFPAGAEQQGELLTNARQAEAAQRAEQALEAVQDGLEAGMSPDAVLSDVEFAMAALAEVTGRRVTEDVTARIFSRFCVGK